MEEFNRKNASTSAFTTDRLPNFSGNSEMASPFRSHIHGGDTKNRDGVLFVDPQQPVLSVAPLNSMPYTGPHVISSDDDLSPTEMESDPMASNEPALVFLPSRPTEEQWNNILAATNRGVGLTGSAAMGKIGPIVGSLDMAESEDAYVFRVSLPGVNQNGFSCDIEPTGKVVIKGVTSMGERTVHKFSQVFEMCTQNLCPPGPFSISFKLPGPVDQQQFNSNFGGDGILEGIVKKMTGTVFLIPGHKKSSMESTSLQRRNPTSGTLSGRQNNRCVIYSANSSMVAESVERRNQSWFYQMKVESDLIIQVEENIFHLHKLPMVSRSGYLNRLIFQRKGINSSPNIRIDNFPGGAKFFELIVKFCYGWKVDLTATNIAPLYCAAHFLEMSDDFEQQNLISQTESFLSFLIFSSWKDTFTIFKSCESISSWARDLQILKRCSEAVAWKACANAKAIESDNNEVECLSVLPDNVNGNVIDGWWFEDVSLLRIDHFIEVIESIKRKVMRTKLVGLCIAHWTVKWLSKIKFGLENVTQQEDMPLELQKVTIESLIRVLPVEENSVSFNFLLHLLKIGVIMKIDSELLNMLEKRVIFVLEKSRAKDLLVRNYEPGGAVYDVTIIARVVEAYLLLVSSNPPSRIFVIGRLVDEYLTLVARDENLEVKNFQLLVEALPRNARYCNDNLYRAIDMYLKAHPSLTEEERNGICRAMEYHKLSQEARKHAMKNDRLPLNIITRFILLDQVNMTRSITTNRTNYQRTKSQAIMRASRGLGKARINSQKEIETMKQDVERIKVKLRELQLRKMELRRQVRRQ
ncbi:unnamed protein product [Camellia sinensis]